MTTKEIKSKIALASRIETARTTDSNELMLAIAKTEKSIRVVRALASNPNLTQEVQDVIIDGSYPASKDPADKKFHLVLRELINNHVITERTQNILAYDKREEVRKMLAESPILTSHVQLYLCRDENPEVRFALLQRNDILKSAMALCLENPKVKEKYDRNKQFLASISIQINTKLLRVSAD